MASGPASHVKPVTKQMFGRASPGAAREAAGEALPNGALLDSLVLLDALFQKKNIVVDLDTTESINKLSSRLLDNGAVWLSCCLGPVWHGSWEGFTSGFT